MKKILGPILTVIGVLAIIYAIYLGVMYAKAEDANKRKEVQGRLIGACVGAVIIVVAVTLCFSINWVSVFENFSGVDIEDPSATTGTQTKTAISRLFR